MRAVIKEPGKEPRSIIVPNKLHTLQELVGGYIDCMAFGDDITILFDDEGKLKGKKPNIALPWDDVIVGTVVFVGSDGEDFTDCPLAAEQISNQLLLRGLVW